MIEFDEIDELENKLEDEEDEKQALVIALEDAEDLILDTEYERNKLANKLDGMEDELACLQQDAKDFLDHIKGLLPNPTGWMH
jgi:chromosome segregation ATPase